MPRTPSRGDAVIGLAFAAGGMGICAHAAGMRAMPGSMAGPGLFPTLTGACMTLFGLVLAAGTLVRILGQRHAPGTGVSPRPNVQAQTLALSAYSMAVLLAVIVLTAILPVLGFLASGIVFTGLVCRLGGAGWLGSAVFGIAMTVALHVAFVHGLGVQLPRGILEG